MFNLFLLLKYHSYCWKLFTIIVIFQICLLLKSNNCVYSKKHDPTICSNEFCHNYTKEYKCTKSHSRSPTKLNFPSPTPCNCCNFPLKKLHAGSDCLIGSPSNVFPPIVCGDQLYCSNEPNTDDAKLTLVGGQSTCREMKTPCMLAMKGWDKDSKDGLLGKLMERPKCDRNGLFTRKCVPGLYCYCQDGQGERIFGEALYEDDTEPTLLCGCSQKVKMFAKNMRLNEKEFNEMKITRCTPWGDFDPIQCFGDKCTCVNPSNGLSDDVRMSDDLVPIYDLQKLKCYDESLHEKYYARPCSDKIQNQLTEAKQLKEQGIDLVGLQWPLCQPDGFYAKVQKTQNKKYCSDRYGSKIEKYETNKEDTDFYNSMNCHCARLESEIKLITKKGNIITSFTPSCCSNGNFARLQCHEGECWCVDTHGNQLTIEQDSTDLDKLDCYHKNNLNECTK